MNCVVGASMQLTSTTWNLKFFFRYVHDVHSSKFRSRSFSITTGLRHFGLLKCWLGQTVVHTSSFVSKVFRASYGRIFIFGILI
jgi:hypothetical protein